MIHTVKGFFGIVNTAEIDFIFLELFIQMGMSFLFSFPFTSVLFSAICKASSDNHFAFLHFLEQQTGSKSGKEYIKAAYCHPAYLTYAE